MISTQRFWIQLRLFGYYVQVFGNCKEIKVLRNWKKYLPIISSQHNWKLSLHDLNTVILNSVEIVLVLCTSFWKLQWNHNSSELKKVFAHHLITTQLETLIAWSLHSDFEFTWDCLGTMYKFLEIAIKSQFFGFEKSICPSSHHSTIGNFDCMISTQRFWIQLRLFGYYVQVSGNCNEITVLRN